jgi:hypothetical protein
VDVVVTDGFTGNVALKTGEGALKLMRDLLRQVFTSSIPARAGYLLARPALERLREWMDPRRYNGAILLGAERRRGEVAWRHRRDRLRPCRGRGDGHGHPRLHPDHPRGAVAPRRPGAAGRRTGLTMMRSVILGCGSYLPPDVLSNDALAARFNIDTTDAWIRERSGITQRHLAGRTRPRRASPPTPRATR